MFGKKKNKEVKTEKKTFSEKVLNKVESMYRMSPLVDEILTEMEQEKQEEIKIERTKAPATRVDHTPSL